MALEIKVGDEITGSYETVARNVVITGRVSSIKGDYVYVPEAGEPHPRPVHRKSITKVNGKRV